MWTITQKHDTFYIMNLATMPNTFPDLLMGGVTVTKTTSPGAVEEYKKVSCKMQVDYCDIYKTNP